MEPQPNLAIVATIQQAITSLLTTSEPAFLRFGNSLFISFATILIVWQGIRMMLTQDSLGDHMFEFAKLLLFISFGYALIAFYQSPIPGIGVSFSHLITDQTQEFANILDARSLELVFDHLDQLWQQFVQPDAWAILANLLYWLLLIVVTLAKVISLAVVALVKKRFDVDDALDVVGVHGVGGTWGAIATGIFATVAVNSAGANGLLYGNPQQLVTQAIAVAVTWVYSCVMTFVILKAVDALIGLRVPEAEEVLGLDSTQHGEIAYQL
jgi:hypothetical protein